MYNIKQVVTTAAAVQQNIMRSIDTHDNIGVARIMSGVHFSSPKKLTTFF